MPEFVPSLLPPVTAAKDDFQSWCRDHPLAYLNSMVESCRSELQATGSFVSMLPLLLTLEGRPYTLCDHFPFEPLFRLCVPRRIIWKCGRQVAKSTSLSANGVVSSALVPFLKTLFVAPRFNQIRWLSNNYVRTFIESSPIKSLLIDEKVDKAVLQRSFRDGAIMFFSFAFLTVDRIRGYSVDKIIYDEVQDLDASFLPIIRECITASPLAIQQYSGTPKTLDNTIEFLWQESSQAEWVSKCDCGYWNTAHIEADLMQMIGKEGVVCGKCSKKLNVRKGHWKHTHPERRSSFAGYHVPQVLLPLHNEDPGKWFELLQKMEGQGNYTKAKFLNEVLGESCDTGVKLVTASELKEACSLPWNNDFHESLRHDRDYSFRVIGIDWGGGGQEMISTTAVIVLGWLPSAQRWDVLYLERLSTALSYFDEIKAIMRISKYFQPRFIAHDFGGSGSVREALLTQAGVDVTTIMPIMYVGNQNDTIVYHPQTQLSSRHYYSIPKSKFLAMVCTAIKVGLIKFPQWNSCEHLVKDFLALYEKKIETRGADTYLIDRNPALPDDVAHAVAFAACAAWYSEKNYPNLAKQAGMKYRMTKEQLAELDPSNPSVKDWSKHEKP